MYACKCVKLGYSINLHSEKPLYCKSEVQFWIFLQNVNKVIDSKFTK